ncbi:hypothetical protein [Hydrogenibacillus schlegelii]|uniref:hypothetical protein n=1 Tax=Hydrogenibacillus schlegelii TaxID=1484 RepID=UPI002356FD62|nr:hypothetical protein [Hydrogenibacillus schlegelii]
MVSLRHRIERLEKRVGEDQRCPVCGGKQPIEWPDLVLLTWQPKAAPRLCSCEQPLLHPTVERILQAYELRRGAAGA